MIKNYILDTNVVLHDPYAIYKFEDNNLLIPIYVIEEVDKFKRELSERGRNAREFIRLMDGLRTTTPSLSDGVRLSNGGVLKVIFPENENILKPSPHPNTDTAILKLAKEIQQKDPSTPTILVTMDINLRLRADVVGIKAVGYENTKPNLILYEEWERVFVSPELLNNIYKTGKIPLKGISVNQNELYPNKPYILVDETNLNHTAIVRADKSCEYLKLIKYPSEGVMGIKPRNKEQKLAFDLLLDDEIKLVILIGKAGTGKTLLALAAGLYKILNNDPIKGSSPYQRLLVSRPIIPLGRDIGYLPGDIESKLNPWMQPIFDNLELILSINSHYFQGNIPSYKELIRDGILEIEPLTYIRGRSLPNQYMIIDEAQNLTPHEVKTIITRAGDNTKIVLTGDPYQIDNPYVDTSSNGLNYAAEKLKSLDISAHVCLVKGERSALAEAAANLL